MERGAIGGDAAVVAGELGIGKIVVEVGVEDFLPCAGIGEADGVVVPGGFGQRGYDDYVLPGAVEPPLEGDYTILVVDVEGVYVFTAEGGLVPAEADGVFGELVVVGHRGGEGWVGGGCGGAAEAGVKIAPVDQVI